MGRIISANVKRKDVIRYLRDVEHQVVDILDKQSEEKGKQMMLSKRALSYMFDNICQNIYEM